MEVCTTAADLISNREYRCLSPNFLFHPETRAVAKLKGAGLVHNPHLYLTALARQESAMPNPETAPPGNCQPGNHRPGRRNPCRFPWQGHIGAQMAERAGGMTEGREPPHSLPFGLRRDGAKYSEFPWSSSLTDGKAPHPVSQIPCIALRSEDRATAARILPCHAC